MVDGLPFMPLAEKVKALAQDVFGDRFSYQKYPYPMGRVVGDPRNNSSNSDVDETRGG